MSSENHALIADPGNLVYVSAATAWEVVIKSGLGRLRFPTDQYREILEDQSFESLPINAEHALAVGRLPEIHRDPFDRLLVAQALTDNLTLLSQDARVLAYFDR